MQIKTNDILTYYERWGKGNPIIFIHGFRYDHKMWQQQVGYFSYKGWETITYDLRGHGRTLSTQDVPFTIDLFASDLSELVKKLGIEKPNVVGISLGGMIAQIYAQHNPVDKLILSDTIYPERTIGLEILFWKLVAHNFKEYFLGKRKMEARDMIKVAQAVHDFKGKSIYNFISSGVLVINGTEEVPQMKKQADKLEDILNAERAEIRGSHKVNLENPDEFNRVVEEFLRGEYESLF